MRKTFRKIHFYTVKLPFIFIMVPTGFVFEYLITFPYIVLTSIEGFLSGKARRRR